MSIQLRQRTIRRCRVPRTFIDLARASGKALVGRITPLVSLSSGSRTTGQFSGFICNLLLYRLRNLPKLNHTRGRLHDATTLLRKGTAVPRIRTGLPLVQRIRASRFLASRSLLHFRRVQRRLQRLVGFLISNMRKRGPICATLTSPMLRRARNGALSSNCSFNRCQRHIGHCVVRRHDSALTVRGLARGVPLSRNSCARLRRVFAYRLNDGRSCTQRFQSAPFNLLMHGITGLSRSTTVRTFSGFVGSRSLGTGRVTFIRGIVRCVRRGNCIRDGTILVGPPFSRPVLFAHLFSNGANDRLVSAVGSIGRGTARIATWDNEVC